MILRTAIDRYRSDGWSGVFRAAALRAGWERARRIRNFGPVREAVLNRRGLEIGGPSGVFCPGGEAPVYPLAAHIDNVNFSHATVWEGTISEGNTFQPQGLREPGRQV